MTAGAGAGPRLPWPAGRRPLSLVAFGNSVTFLQMPPRKDRGQGVYLEVAADRLTAAGVPAHAYISGKWFDFLHRAMRDYETRVRPMAPDVLVVHFGLNEYQPWLMPIWMIRHLLVQNMAVSRSAKAYRRRIAKPLWRKARTYRRWAARWAGTRTWQTTPRRFGGHLERLIRTARNEGKPLVLVLDIDEPGGVLAHFLPGLPERHAIFQERLAQVVTAFGHPDVRLLRISELTRDGGTAALPDGMHFSVDTHRRVGELIAAEVVSWLQSRSE